MELMYCMKSSLAINVPTENLANAFIGVTFVTGVTVTGVTGVTLSKKQFCLDFDYSGIVPVYSGQFGASARGSFNRCNMKTISRKQAREAIQSKGLVSAIGIGKTGLTAKQRKFAEKIVLDGLNASDAYRAAYDTSAKANTINVNASKLAHNTKVANTIQALEQAKAASALHSIESLKALVISTLTDIATNSDKDAVRVQAVKTLGTVVGVDMFRETKRIETVKDSDQIREQILGQLKTMMLGSDSAVDVDANDLLSELTAADPTHAPPPETVDGTPPCHVHTIPLEPSQEFTDSEEDPPFALDSSTPRGDIFLEDEVGYQDATGRVSTLKVKS
jgi:phage terminase small subunit